MTAREEVGFQLVAVQRDTCFGGGDHSVDNHIWRNTTPAHQDKLDKGNMNTIQNGDKPKAQRHHPEEQDNQRQYTDND